MDRTRRLGLVALAALTWAPSAIAQQRHAMRVGVVFYRAPPSALGPSPSFFLAAALRDGMRALGWVEGRDIAFHWRSAEGDERQIPLLIDELVKMPVDLLALSGNNIIAAGRAATRTIPIVMLASNAPVEEGLISALAKPGGNVTGMTNLVQAELVGKRLELLKEAAPAATTVALLHDGITRELAAAHAQAASLGRKLLTFAVDNAGQLREAMRGAKEAGAGAATMETSYGTAPETHPEIAALVLRYRMPMIHRFREAVTSGHALMSYAPDPLDDYRRACVFIDRILKGAAPGSLPIEVADKFYLDVNLRLANQIGWRIPPSILARADNVIRD